MSFERREANGLSKRQEMKRVYEEVNDIAKPGDVIFFISERSGDQSLQMLRQLYRRWQGFADEDNTNWHTTMSTGARKDSRGSAMRPHIIHAAQGGVSEIHIPPSFFTSIRSDEGEVVQYGRIEVIKSPDVSPDEREALVRYTRKELGKPFANLNWKHDVLTYALGLPAGKLDPTKASCHGLIFDAYDHIGFSFAHRLEDAPFFNIGKHLGHPIGEDPEKVDVRRLYLHDHHLYRDPRFLCVLSVFENRDSGEIKTVRNPGKYSWNTQLQQKYGV